MYDKLEQYRTKTRDEMDRERTLVIHYLKWGYDWLRSNLEKIHGQTSHDHPHISLL